MIKSSFFFQAEDGIRDLVRSRGLGDVYKRQDLDGDGVPASVDCNDNNAAIRPGVVEICDGLDNDLSLIHI